MAMVQRPSQYQRRGHGGFLLPGQLATMAGTEPGSSVHLVANVLPFSTLGVNTLPAGDAVNSLINPAMRLPWIGNSAEPTI